MACLEDIVENAERSREGAHQLGERATGLMPDQPWSDIRGTGNRLRQAYDRISLDVTCNAARHDLPGLAVEAGRALARVRVSKSRRGG